MQDGKKPAKLGHKKSRTGCLKCRARRVKCDEQTPTCSNCTRLGLQCEYSSRLIAHKPRQQSATGSSDKDHAGTTPEELQHHSRGSSMSNPRPRDLHRIELKLLHAYTSRPVHATPVVRDANLKYWIQAFFIDVPRMAFQNDNLLYALLSFAATQVLHSEPEAALARCEFWDLALSHQRQALSQPIYNVEAAALAGYFICMTSFGMLNDRDLEPYTPPMDWFELAQNANNVCPRMKQLAEPSALLKILKMMSPLWQDVVPMDKQYEQILQHHTDEEYDLLSVEEIRETANTYELALQVVSCFNKSVRDEPPYHSHRWICLFPQMVPGRFVAFLRESRPRALVVMICFWSVLAKTEPQILLAFGDATGDLPKREIAAITKSLPSHWVETVHNLPGLT